MQLEISRARAEVEAMKESGRLRRGSRMLVLGFRGRFLLKELIRQEIEVVYLTNSLVIEPSKQLHRVCGGLPHLPFLDNTFHSVLFLSKSFGNNQAFLNSIVEARRVLTNHTSSTLFIELSPKRTYQDMLTLIGSRFRKNEIITPNTIKKGSGRFSGPLEFLAVRK